MNWQDIIIKLAAALLAAVGAWALAKLKTFINSKIKNENVKSLLNAATDAVASAVKATYQTYVEAIKGTEEWTEEAQKNALSLAANTAKEQMSEEVQNYITENFGDIDNWLVSQIEATLYDLKNGTSEAQNASA